MIRLAQDEEDRLDRYPPTVRYLQKLGAEYLDTILESSKWILDEDPNMGIQASCDFCRSTSRNADADRQIFTADEPTVEAWPRQRVVDFLDKQHQPSCVLYLEHIIHELKEEGSEFHDKLAELYVSAATSAPPEGTPTPTPQPYTASSDS